MLTTLRHFSIVENAMGFETFDWNRRPKNWMFRLFLEEKDAELFVEIEVSNSFHFVLERAAFSGTRSFFPGTLRKMQHGRRTAVVVAGVLWTAKATNTTRAGRPTIVTSQGRAGTTFLMRLFTEVGMPTGISVAEARRVDDESEAHAGLENFADIKTLRQHITKGVEIFKSPFFAASFDMFDDAHDFKDFIFPLRSPRDTARSRQRVHSAGADKGSFWGGATTATEQEDVDSNILLHSIIAATRAHKFVTFLWFPDHVINASYAYSRLHWLCHRYHVDKADFLTAHARISNKLFVHTFTSR